MNTVAGTIGKLCEFIKIELRGLYPELEISSLTDIIISHLLGIPKHEIHIEKEKPISEMHGIRAIEIVKELKTGKPVQYILGFTEFYGLFMHVSPDVLIPRPETEELVKWIIDDHACKSPVILDIGTGSGCIAIALKKNLLSSTVYACDISASALKIAQKNASVNSVDIVIFQQDISNTDIVKFAKEPGGDLTLKQLAPEANPEYDIIVSNPPYIPLREKPLININISGFEPGNSLFVPDDDPLMFYRYIAYFGLNHLKKNGQIYFEINEKSGSELKKLLEKSGYRNVTLQRDLNGKDRMMKCFI
jgi:release factor glutamine methyltransferase